VCTDGFKENRVEARTTVFKATSLSSRPGLLEVKVKATPLRGQGHAFSVLRPQSFVFRGF